MHFEHLPGMENPTDIFTKLLPWFILKNFVEPLLFWKGDTAAAPSGAHNPEGSVADPGYGQSREAAVESQRGEPTQRGDGEHTQGADVLWNNQYAALHEDDGNG